MVSGILLAGGGSRRMGGINKALLEIGGRRIIERVADVLVAIFPEVIVITNSPEEFEFLGLPMAGDLMPRRGSLVGLYTGLSVCRGDYAFLVACDMPFLNRGVIAHMLGLIEGYDVVVPKISGMWEPLHAIYSRACLPHIQQLLEEGDLRIFDFFRKVRVREVPEEDLKRFDERLLFLINLNTPEDLRRAAALACESLVT